MCDDTLLSIHMCTNIYVCNFSWGRGDMGNGHSKTAM